MWHWFATTPSASSNWKSLSCEDIVLHSETHRRPATNVVSDWNATRPRLTVLTYWCGCFQLPNLHIIKYYCIKCITASCNCGFMLQNILGDNKLVHEHSRRKILMILWWLEVGFFLLTNGCRLNASVVACSDGRCLEAGDTGPISRSTWVLYY